MAACTKVAAFGALLRVFYVPSAGARWDWQPVMWVVAIITMVVGSVIALTQTDVKRMLAYSSIAHAGFILVGLLATRQERRRRACCSTCSPTGSRRSARSRVVTLVRDVRAARPRTCRSGPASARASPAGGRGVLAVPAGLRGLPLTSGFIGEVRGVLGRRRARRAGLAGRSAASASAIAAFFYVRVFVLMFFSEPHRRRRPSWPCPAGRRRVAIAVCATVTIVLGVAPAALLDLAAGASVFAPVTTAALDAAPAGAGPGGDAAGRPRAGRGAAARGGRARPTGFVDRDLRAPRAGRRQAVPPLLVPDRRRTSATPTAARVLDRRPSSSSSPTWRRCTTTTSWTTRRCAGARHRRTPLGQHRRDPDRRPAVRPRVEGRRRPRRRGRAPAGADLRAAVPRAAARDRRARPTTTTPSSTTSRCSRTRPVR